MSARYIKRALKQLLYITIFMLIVVSLIYFLSYRDPNFTYTDFWKNFLAEKNGVRIALFLLVISAIYPIFGYSKREITVKGSLRDNYNAIISAMQSCGFEPENEDMRDNSVDKEGHEEIRFRYRNKFIRLMRVYEDTITVVDKGDGLIEAEGLRKEIVRVGSAIERAVSPSEQD